jgi:endonuclease/exonuclease/phosphatase family metal-dependent hydrolase
VSTTPLAAEADTSSAAQSAVLTVLCANLLSGGIGRSRGEHRFPELMDIVARLRPDVFAVQECLYWDEHDHRLFGQAQRRLGMTGVLGISPRTRMHTAVFVRAPLRLAEWRIDRGGIWHHSATHALVEWDARGQIPSGRLRVGSMHLSPRNPARRLLEAGELTGYGASPDPAVLLGDTNTQDEHTDLSAAPADLLARYARLGTTIPDTASVDLLTSAGLVDLAVLTAEPGAVPTRTTGHWPGKQHVRGRPDRALGNPRVTAALVDITVVAATGHPSDHGWLLVGLDKAVLAAPPETRAPADTDQPEPVDTPAET